MTIATTATTPQTTARRKRVTMPVALPPRVSTNHAKTKTGGIEPTNVAQM